MSYLKGVNYLIIKVVRFITIFSLGWDEKNDYILLDCALVDGQVHDGREGVGL